MDKPNEQKDENILFDSELIEKTTPKTINNQSSEEFEISTKKNTTNNEIKESELNENQKENQSKENNNDSKVFKTKGKGKKK